MNVNDDESNPVAESEPATPSPPLVPAIEGGPPAVPIRGRRLWPVVLASALIGGALGWLGGEAAFDHFVLPEELDARSASISATQADMDEAGQFRLKNETRNGALALGLLGAAMGLTLGLAGGIVGRRPKRGLAYSIPGLIVGGALVAGVVLALQPALKTWQTENPDDLLSVLLLHGVLAAAVGASGGLAFGLGLGERGWTPRALLGGLAGAALAALLFQMVAGAAFPIGRPDYIVPTTPSTRLVARLVLGLGTALGVCLARPVAPRAVVKVQEPSTS
ncbi:MAG: hypothetical protein ABI353_01360 [Isosphaeraceae bacterium]